MDKLSIIVVSVLFSSIIAMLGYFLKSAHQDNKEMFKELSEVKQLLIAIKTQVEKSIINDIEDVKENVKTLFERTRRNENAIGKITNCPNKKVEE
jgi:hypothetical protein